MSNLSLVPDVGDELPSQQVARKVRGVMAEHKISGRTLAAAMHMDQKAFSRRYSGKQAWSFDEVVQLCDLLRLELTDLYATTDSNREPADWGEITPDLHLLSGGLGFPDDCSGQVVFISGTDSSHEVLGD